VAHIGLGSDQVSEAGRTMQQIVGSVERVTSTMREIATATSEQSDAIEQVSSTVVHMDRSTQQNAALVEHTAQAARALKDQADLLVESVAVFRFTGDDLAHDAVHNDAASDLRPALA
jgi:methyl-accepting chemotaxis protein-1 (serine sensor receptor)